jgi:lipoate-protein ligase A
MNLALEQAILDSLSGHEKVLLLYSNKPCVVMGRFQNPWLECELDLVKENNVSLVRRQSGGGTVYHDLNNINFCFLQKDREHQKNTNNKILINALQSLDIPAYQSDRSDLLVDFEGVRKFSGSAFKQKKDRSFHHGTLLVNSDLLMLNKYLHTNQKVIKTNSTKSVRAHVINLKEINPNLSEALLDKALVESLEKYYEISCESLTQDDFTISIDYYNELKTWKWIYGETPLFEMTSDKGVILQIKKGVILSVQFNKESDFNVSMVSELEKSLVEKSIEKQQLDNHFEDFILIYDMYKSETKKLQSELYLALNL